MPLLQSSSSLKTKHLPLNRFSFFLGFLFVSLAAVAAFYLGLPLNFIPNLSLKALAILSSVVGALGAFALFSLGHKLKKNSANNRAWPTILLSIALMTSFALYAAFEITTGLLGLRIAMALGIGVLATYTALSPLAIQIGRIVEKNPSTILILPLALLVMRIFLAVDPTSVARFLWHYPVLLALTATVLLGLGVGVLSWIGARTMFFKRSFIPTGIEMDNLSGHPKERLKGQQITFPAASNASFPGGSPVIPANSRSNESPTITTRTPEVPKPFSDPVGLTGLTRSPSTTSTSSEEEEPTEMKNPSGTTTRRRASSETTFLSDPAGGSPHFGPAFFAPPTSPTQGGSLTPQNPLSPGAADPAAIPSLDSPIPSIHSRPQTPLIGSPPPKIPSRPSTPGSGGSQSLEGFEDALEDALLDSDAGY